MLSQSDLQLFFDIASTYQSQSLKTYTIAFKDRFLIKIQDASHIANQITTDVKKEILNDEFFSKKEFDFLLLVALENKDQYSVNIIQNYIRD